MKLFFTCLAACLCLSAAVGAQDDPNDGYRQIYREAAVKWAEFLGVSDACSYRHRKAMIEEEAEQAAGILNPGLIAWLTGDQADTAEELVISMNLAYSTAQLSPSCMGAEFLEQSWGDLMHRALDSMK